MARKNYFLVAYKTDVKGSYETITEAVNAFKSSPIKTKGNLDIMKIVTWHESIKDVTPIEPYKGDSDD